MVVGDEGLGRRPTRNRLHHRRFDFREARGRQPLAQGSNGGSANLQGAARRLGHDQVYIALAVAGFGVAQAMPFFRQGAQGLGQQLQGMYPQAELPGLGAEEGPLDPNHVSQIELLEAGIACLAQLVAAQEKLQPTATILEIGKARLAHDAPGHQAPAQACPDRLLLQGGGIHVGTTVLQIAGFGIAAEGIGIGLPGLAPTLQLLVAHLHLIVAFFHACPRLTIRPSRPLR